MDKQDIVQIPSRAIQLKIGGLKICKNKAVIIYNKANGYIVDAVLKAVFNDAH